MKGAIFRLAALGLIALAGLPLPSQARSDASCSKPVHVALFEFGVLYRSATSDGIDARLLDTLELDQAAFEAGTLRLGVWCAVFGMRLLMTRWHHLEDDARLYLLRAAHTRLSARRFTPLAHLGVTPTLPDYWQGVTVA